MAEQGSTIFNRTAQERLRSPDDLDKYVRVTTPSKWALLAAFAILLVGILAWGFFGTVSTNVLGTGVVTRGTALCYLPGDEVVRVREGDAAFVGGAKLKVAEIAKVPSSRVEAEELLGSDYLTETLVEGRYGTKVTFEGDVSSLAEGVPLEVNITTGRVAPITLVLG